MKYDSQDKLIVAALDIVKRCDPDTYNRMSNEPQWLISTDPSRALRYESLRSRQEARYILSNDLAFGLTRSKADNPGHPVTILNPSDLAAGASNLNVPLALFAADVLVHEFAHVNQPAGNNSMLEAKAFAAGSKFARLLPTPYNVPIARLSDSMYYEALRGGATL